MSIPPLPPASIASLAGSDRAARTSATENSVTEQAKSNARSNLKEGANVDSVNKGNSTDDRDADGRQLLDTFERQTKDQNEQNEQNDKPEPNAKNTDPADASKSVRSRLDFTA